jgi:hypothetical protein
MDPDADPGGPKTYESYGSGSGSATLIKIKLYCHRFSQQKSMLPKCFKNPNCMVLLRVIFINSSHWDNQIYNICGSWPLYSKGMMKKNCFFLIFNTDQFTVKLDFTAKVKNKVYTNQNF